MTASTLPVTFRRQDAAAAYRRLIVRFGRDPRWQKAIRRAWEHLDTPGWQWDGIVLMTRSSSDVTIRYRTTAAGCDCPTGALGNVCWHIAARWICTEAGKPNPN